MAERELHFLHFPRRTVRSDDRDVSGLSGRSAAVAGQRDRHRAALAGRDQPLDDVARRAGRRDADRDVAAPGKTLELSREDALETIVVGDGGERRRIDGQRDAGIRGALEHEPARQLRREMLCLGRAAAVAEEEHAAVAADAAHDRVDRALDRRGVIRAAPQIGPLRHTIREALASHWGAHVSIQNSSWCRLASSASAMQIFTILPSYSLTISFINFMASKMQRTWPSATTSPTSTKCWAFGAGER